MLRLPPFEYLAPRTLDEAVEMLAEYGSLAMLVAGGTDVYPGMKRRIFKPKKLVGLRQIAELKKFVPRYVEGLDAGNGLTLGAGLTLAQVATNPLIKEDYPALASAAEAVSTAQLRYMGTIGGNLCLDTRCTYYNQSEPWRKALGYCMKLDGHICWVAPGSRHCWAVQSSDTAPVLVALGAKVKLVGPTGPRVIPVEALYHNDGMDYLKKRPSEILSEIYLPPPLPRVRQTYKKLRRRGAFDFPILSVAVALRIAPSGRGYGTCTEANIVLGAVASAPLRAYEAEAILIGEKINDEVIEEAAKHAFKVAKPLDNTDMSISYRKQMVRVYVARALRESLVPRVKPLTMN